jgi:uncharacterized protein (TIGR02246 family)
MKKHILTLISLVALLGTGQVSADESTQQIAESNVAKWNEAFAHGKVDDIVSLYTDNAMLVQPNGSISKNTSEIRAFWQTMIEKRGGVLAIDVVEVKGEHDDTIVTTTRISEVKTLPASAQAQVMKYQYDGVLYSVLKRQHDGSWKAEVQQWRDNGHGV